MKKRGKKGKNKKANKTKPIQKPIIIIFICILLSLLSLCLVSAAGGGGGGGECTSYKCKDQNKSGKFCLNPYCKCECGTSNGEVYCSATICTHIEEKKCEDNNNFTIIHDGVCTTEACDGYLIFLSQNCGAEGKICDPFYGCIFPPLRVTLFMPVDGSEISCSSPFCEVTFNCFASGGRGSKNLSLYGNWSGGWHMNFTNTTSGQNISLVKSLNLSLGTYKWNCLVRNATHEEWHSQNFTFTIQTSVEINECEGYNWYTINISHLPCNYRNQLCVTNRSSYRNYNKFVHYCKKEEGGYYLKNVTVLRSPQQQEEQQQEGIIQKIINWLVELII
ncbi:MAG: hypothetical protein NZ889_01210 [Candidatus Pacearchaeota archaeon]|nr:hypothetical protein [Candidatus Pacearchaeota archaeon]